MKLLHKIDANGFFIEDVILQDNEQATPDLISIQPVGFHKPKWSGGKWVEGLTAPELTAVKNTQRKAEIIARLSKIDIEALRPLREVANNTATKFDTDKLTKLDTEAKTLRTELAGL